MAADRGEVLEVLDRLTAARGAARAKRRAEKLLEQSGLAVGGGAKDAKVPAGDPVLRKLRGGANDLEVGLVESKPAIGAVRLDDAELAELAQELC